MSVRSAVILSLLAGCGSLDAREEERASADEANQALWWLWSSGQEEEEEVEEVATPSEPGDPAWFDAHCDEQGCVVGDDFDPVDHLQLAYDLCDEALAVEDELYFQRVSFTTERVYAEDFRASEADWEYRFVVPDPDDLWGYTWLECYVRVHDGAVATGSTYNAGPITHLDGLIGRVDFGIAEALDDLGSLGSVNRGGIRWDSLHDVGEVYLVDDRWDDTDTWNALTGERD